MTTYIYRNGELVEKGSAPPREGGYVISDEISETRHMADGRYYTSKKKFRQATRDAGCIEIGNESAALLKPRKSVQMDPAKRRDDIRRAIYELRNR